MRVLICIVLLMASSSLWAQSKKELRAEVEKQQAEIEGLNAEIILLNTPKVIDMENPHKKASYGLGVLMASGLKEEGSDSLDTDALFRGFSDIFQEKMPEMDREESAMVVQEYMQKMAERKSAAAMAEGLKFLEENKQKEGVIVTASGLQYKILTPGTGKTPLAESKVTAHYTGKLLDGTVFDSSVERGEPIELVAGQVIEGWSEALQLMKEGSKWQLFVPHELAYGERGAGGVIPPFATLIFEVELLKVD